jgi:CheY-like chemotaxis protein
MQDTEFPDLSEITALVVDDLDFSRTLARKLLAVAGARQVTAAENVAEAWSIIRGASPDLVVVDWELAGPSGIDLCRKIRTSGDTPNRFVPILMMTAYRESHRVREAIAAGISAYLVKPFSPSEFLRRIKFCIEDRRPFVQIGDQFGPAPSKADRELMLQLEQC